MNRFHAGALPAGIERVSSPAAPVPGMPTGNLRLRTRTFRNNFGPPLNVPQFVSRGLRAPGATGDPLEAALWHNDPVSRLKGNVVCRILKIDDCGFAAANQLCLLPFCELGESAALR